jgi:hypothetical protein
MLSVSPPVPLLAGSRVFVRFLMCAVHGRLSQWRSVRRYGFVRAIEKARRSECIRFTQFSRVCGRARTLPPHARPPRLHSSFSFQIGAGERSLSDCVSHKTEIVPWRPLQNICNDRDYFCCISAPPCPVQALIPIDLQVLLDVASPSTMTGIRS